MGLVSSRELKVKDLESQIWFRVTKCRIHHTLKNVIIINRCLRERQHLRLHFPSKFLICTINVQPKSLSYLHSKFSGFSHFFYSSTISLCVT